MDSEVADKHDNGEHERDSSADLHDSDQFPSMNSPDLVPTNSFNGDLQHLHPLPDPLSSTHTDLSAEIERSIADNQVLVDEVASLRDGHAASEDTRQLLQRELLASSERGEALNAEIVSLEVEKRKHEDLAACMAQEVHALHAEKMDLHAGNENTASETKSLDVMLAETKEKSSSLARDVDEKQVALAAAQTRVHMICFEVEKLQLDKEEYSKEVSLLDASNGAIDTQISQLRDKENGLANEVAQMVAAKTMTEQKVSDAQASIAALRVQVSTLRESDGGMQNQLSEAKERLQHLEEQDNAMALSERDMETCIVDLESRLHTIKAIFNTTEQALGQEKEANSKALEESLVKKATSDRDLPVVELPSNVKQQHVQDLQRQVSDLLEEKEVLARSNEELQVELSKTKEEPEAEGCIQLEKDIKRLEGTLKEAEERAHFLESKEIELKYKLQELTILAERKSRLAGLATPLMISGGTIVALGLLVYLVRSNSKAK